MRFMNLVASILALPFVTGAPAADATIGGLTIGAIINAIGIGIVKDINVIITLDSLVSNIVQANFDATNPLPFELSIDRVVSSAGLNGTVFAQFDQTFSSPIVIPPFGTKNSGTFGNVLLTQGATAALNIIPAQELDLSHTNVFVRAASIDGILGFPLEIDGLKQANVPATYDISLSA
ncbi:hypothetical protein H0H93_012339 [Arthromyces matolae]|nr:hypothetical protein H0H93_012339 [Arthromyces matolae]